MDSRLDKIISDVGYVLDCLMTLRRIQNSGDCNDCAMLHSQCRYAPKSGEQVRYNCPFYSRESERSQDDRYRKKKN